MPRPSWRTESSRSAVLIVSAGVISLLIAYIGSFGLHRFADDWAFVYRASEGDPIGYMLEPFYQHWSPFWHATEILNFHIAGWMDDWFIRTLIIGTRILSFGVVWWIARRLRFTTLATVVAIGVLGLHHAQGVSIYSFDTYTQCVTDALGWLAIVAFWSSLDRSRPLFSTPYLLSLALLVAAMLYKEQGLAAAGVMVGIAAVQFFEKGAWRFWMTRVIQTCWPLVVAVAIFTAARASAGLFLGDGGRFGLSVTSVPVNMAQLLFAVLTPVKTIDWFDALRAEPLDVAALVTYGVFAAVLGVTLLSGVVIRARRSGQFHRGFWLLALAMVASWFPVSIMEKVGELYAHTPLLWYALLVGFSADGWWRLVRGSSQLKRSLVVGLSFAYLGVLAVGLRANLAEVWATADRAEVWLARFDEALSGVPPGSGVIVFSHEPRDLPEEYSLYRAITPHSLNLVVKGRPSLSYLTDSEVDFFVAPRKPADDLDLDSRFAPGTPVFELHVRNDAIEVRRR